MQPATYKNDIGHYFQGTKRPGLVTNHLNLLQRLRAYETVISTIHGLMIHQT
jgi:hypothetical protein